VLRSNSSDDLTDDTGSGGAEGRGRNRAASVMVAGARQRGGDERDPWLSPGRRASVAGADAASPVDRKVEDDDLTLVLKRAIVNLSPSDFFRKIDDDKSGFLSRSELHDGLRDHFPGLNHASIHAICDRMDTDGDDKIDLDEFAAVCKDLKIWSSTGRDPRYGDHQIALIRRIRQALVRAKVDSFATLFEQNADEGRLSSDGFKAMVRELDLQLSPINLALLYKTANQDGHSYLCLAEFYHMMTVT